LVCDDFRPNERPGDDADDDESVDDGDADDALDEMARELFGGPAWDEVLSQPPEQPADPTPGERLLYALGQLLRLNRAGRFPVHPRDIDVEDLLRVLGLWRELEFASRNRLGRHYHFSTEVLTVSAEAPASDPFPWRLLSIWEWAAEQELNNLWLDAPDPEEQ
jgi:hypothetical protein